MIELDPSLLAPDVAMLLLLRGAAVPPLQWHEKPNRIAQQTLQNLADDARLLRCTSLADAGLAGAVRAMLYLWNGWLEECARYAQTGPEPERNYLLGMCARQAGRPAQAKTFFQQVPEHAIYTPLACYAYDVIAPGAGGLLQRYRDILKLDHRWETCAFVDLVEQARANKLGAVGEETVRRLQCREFELLLEHCYQAATGAPIPERAARGALNQSALTQLRKKRGPRRREPEAVKSKPEAPTQPPKKAGPPPTAITVVCPKCKTQASLPASARGNTARCERCGTVFLVPSGQSTGLTGRLHLSPSNFALECPKCAGRMTVPEAARGQREKCPQCGTVLLIPPRKPSPVAGVAPLAG